MFTTRQKRTYLKNLLLAKELSYADSFHSDILFAIEGQRLSVLTQLSTKEEIDVWLEKLKSRIVMHEDDQDVREIIDEYIFGDPLDLETLKIWKKERASERKHG